MNHLLRAHAPISETGLGAARRGGARAARAGAGGAQARRLRRAARLGALGHEPRPHGRAARRRRSRASRRSQRGCCRWSSCAPISSSRGRSSATPTAAPTTPTSTRSTRPRTRSRMAENAAVFHGWAGRRSGASPRLVPLRARERSATSRRALPAARSPRAVERAAHAAASAAPTASRSAASSTGSRSQTAEHGGTLLARAPARDPRRARSSGRRGSTGGVVVSLRGGDFVLDSGQDLSIGYDSHDAELVRLYIEESFSFHVATPEAAVVLLA